MRDIDFRLAEADGTVRDVLTAARPDHPLCETALNERVITVIKEWQNENGTE